MGRVYKYAVDVDLVPVQHKLQYHPTIDANNTQANIMVYESKLEGIDRIRFQFCIVDEAHIVKRVTGGVNNFVRQFSWDSLICITAQEVRTNIPPGGCSLNIPLQTTIQRKHRTHDEVDVTVYILYLLRIF
ncbi:uncharacterized protein FPRO_07513 [Fusarium proliferatum ET1]|uniref:Uncharacterized protein n=2 Tax=Gibberella intermedia TaxID=948311 RepID=A0A1L7VUG3_FUSPR|nr:uncharacterized protein FPRO_07513 [Fusarium proliferatum ET1]RBA21305.1 hypothetical protein FPRO05_07619 [Fusarium proliferatum]CZR43570.1 uncharacterized protein FPRO_07513 [Fusarium proliferatum ET1]